MVKKNACVFISGNGTNLRSLLLSSNIYNFPIKIKLVVSNKKNAKGLLYAKKRLIPYYILKNKNLLSEANLINLLKRKKISIICLAGYMKILPKKFIQSLQAKIINIHPSLLPKYKGLNTFDRALKNKEKKIGCTVHFVNEKLDDGRIILNKIFYINKNDSVEKLKKRNQILEYKAYTQAIYKIYNNC